MDFFKSREIFSLNFRNSKNNYQIIVHNQFNIYNSFLVIEKIIENLINLSFKQSFKTVKNFFKEKIIIKKFIKFSFKLEKIKTFISFFKNQNYDLIISNLCYFFYIILKEFNIILLNFYSHIYNGWFNLKIILDYLNPSRFAIQVCFKLIKKILKKKKNSLFLINYSYIKILKQNFNSIYFLTEYCLNFQFNFLINKLFIFGNIEDYQGNFINLLQLKKKFNNSYHIILEKKLHIYQKKILKFAFIISFLIKNFSYLTKIIIFNKNIKNKFISVQNSQKNKIKNFLKNIFFKIAKSIFFFTKDNFLTAYNFKKILFFFCFAGENLNSFINISTIYKKKINSLKKIFFKNKTLSYNEKVLGCFTIDFIDYSYCKLIGFYYFKNFLKNKKKNFYFPLNKFSKKYKIEKINLNCIFRWPFFCFISKNSIKKYRILGKFLFKIKIIENILINNWNNHISIFHYFYIGINRISFFLNRIFLSFFKSLITYFLFEVLESNWTLFINKIKNFNSVNLIMISHEFFLRDCINQIYLNKPKISKIITRIFSIAKLFTFFIKKFSLHNNFIQNNKNNLEKKDDLKFKNFFEKILIFKKSYYMQLIILIKILKKDIKINKYKCNLEKFLNFNEFFI
jgi:hypothetical protein